VNVVPLPPALGHVVDSNVFGGEARILAASSRGLLVKAPLDVEGLGGDEPRAVNEVKRKIVDIQDGIDPNPNLDEGLRGRSEIDQQDFLMPWRIFRLGDGFEARSLRYSAAGRMRRLPSRSPWSCAVGANTRSKRLTSESNIISRYCSTAVIRDLWVAASVMVGSVSG
jgi:hypothetical protein